MAYHRADPCCTLGSEIDWSTLHRQAAGDDSRFPRWTCLGGITDACVLARQHLICRSAMRTTKLLVGLAKGVDVLSVEWLEKCAELKRMIGQYSAVYLILSDTD